MNLWAECEHILLRSKLSYFAFTNLQQSELQIISLSWKNLEIILNKISKLSFKSIVVSGDFNIDFLSESHEKEQFLNLLHSFNLDITVNVPTRNTLKSQKALDQIIIKQNHNYIWNNNE